MSLHKFVFLEVLCLARLGCLLLQEFETPVFSSWRWDINKITLLTVVLIWCYVLSPDESSGCLRVAVLRSVWPDDPRGVADKKHSTAWVDPHLIQTYWWWVPAKSINLSFLILTGVSFYCSSHEPYRVFRTSVLCRVRPDDSRRSEG